MYYYLLYITVCSTYYVHEKSLTPNSVGHSVLRFVSLYQIFKCFQSDSTGNCSISPLKCFIPPFIPGKSTHQKTNKKWLKKVLSSEIFKKLESFWIRFDSSNCKSSHGMTSLFARVVIVTHLNFNWAKNGDHPLDEWFQSSHAPIRTEFQPFKTCKIGESGKYFRITGHPSSINPRSWLAV